MLGICSAFGNLGSFGVQRAIGLHSVKDAVAGDTGGPFVAVRSPGLRGLRQRNQKCRLRGRQAAGILGKPDASGCAHAFDITTIGRAVQVKGQDLVLRQVPFQCQRNPHLPQLPRPPAGRPIFQQARRLHR